jgi:hypothetical protein
VLQALRTEMQSSLMCIRARAQPRRNHGRPNVCAISDHLTSDHQAQQSSDQIKEHQTQRPSDSAITRPRLCWLLQHAYNER